MRAIVPHLATDPRDYVYSMLGHPALRSVDGKEPLVQPDYTISFHEVLRRLAVACLVKKHDLSILSMVQHEQMEPSLGRPTWVPRFSISLFP